MIPEVDRQYKGQYGKQLVVRCPNSSWIVGERPNNPEYGDSELYWVHPRECPESNPTAFIKQAQNFRRCQDVLTPSQAECLLAMVRGREHFCDTVGKFRLRPVRALISKGFAEQVGLGSGWITVRLSEKGYRRQQDLKQDLATASTA